MAKAATAKKPKAGAEAGGERPVCGIIMPISAIPPEYDASHWADVRRVLDEAIEAAEMVPQIVSDSFETDVIQRRIVHNLYENPVVVCDVSGLNPNVMFELGMRLTFMKPVVIVTDDVKRIPFDTGVIEHLAYPRDLHIHKTQEFIEQLTEKIKSLLTQVAGKKFKPFLETFGKFEVFQPSTESVPADRFIAERLEELTRAVRRLERSPSPSLSSRNFRSFIGTPKSVQELVFAFPDAEAAMQALKSITRRNLITNSEIRGDKNAATLHLEADSQDATTEKAIRDIAGGYGGSFLFSHLSATS